MHGRRAATDRRPPTTRSVALGVTLSLPFDSGWLADAGRAIIDATVRRESAWEFIRDLEGGIASPFGQRGMGCDVAVIYSTDRRATVRLARRVGHVINLAADGTDCSTYQITTDDEAVGRLAAEHFASVGIRRMIGIGIRHAAFSRRRLAGFTRAAECSGQSFDLVDVDPDGGLDPFLAALPTADGSPVGVFAVHDPLAARVASACRVQRRAVPGDVAVLGAGNDPLVRRRTNIDLSSVAFDGRSIGEAVVELLDDLATASERGSGIRLVSPIGVEARASTDIFVCPDPHVAAAIRWMRGHLGEPFVIKQVVHAIGASRRRVEQGFRSTYCCTPAEFLLRLRVERASQLLGCEPRLSMERVAAACGFECARTFRRGFRRVSGGPPSAWPRRKSGTIRGRGR